MGTTGLTILAGKGSEIYQAPEMTMKIVNGIDSEAWIIHRRVLNISLSSGENNIKKDKFPPKPKCSPLDRELEELDHQFKCDEKERHTCMQCGQKRNRKHRHAIINTGQYLDLLFGVS